ncbi:MAG: DUF6744 family protein [Archaeoglobaceae archaeon]
MKPCKINGFETGIADSDSQIIGYAVWFTISKTRAPWYVVNEALAKAGLPMRIKRPAPLDVFERITGEYRETEIENDHEKRITILLRKVNDHTRKVVVEKLFKTTKKVEYTECAEIILADPLKVIKYRDCPEAEQVVHEIEEKWKSEKECITEDTLRKMLLKILDRSGRIKLKPSGSIYFVPEEQFEMIERFGEFIDILKEKGHGKNSEIWYAPVINSERFREMIKLKINGAIQEEFERIFEAIFGAKNEKRDIKEIISKDSIIRLKRIVQLYSEILGEETRKVEKVAGILRNLRMCKNDEEIPEMIEKLAEELSLEDKLEQLKQALLA